MQVKIDSSFQLLVLSPAKFVEWLLQQGLVLQEQHEIKMGKRSKLKLAMHNDVKRY